MPTQLLEDAPIPANSAWVIPPNKNDRPGGPPPWRPSPAILGYMTRLGSNVNAAPAIINQLRAVDQNESIAPTDLSGGALAAGLYELRYWATLVFPDGVSSSLDVTFSWTYRGVTQNAQAVALSTDTLGENSSGVTPLFFSDAASPITVETIYSSGIMKYDFYAVLLRVRA